MTALSTASRASGSAAALPSVRHIRLTLDPDIVFERLILAQLARRSRTRAHHWLRSVLVQGFLTEGKWLQSAEHSEQAPALAGIDPVTRSTPYGEWCAGAGSAAVTRTDATQAHSISNRHDKPFASLRRVIG